MKPLLQVSWTRVLGEGLIIVVSILLAFWIQAWWEGRQDSERERHLLHALRDDLISIQEYRESRDQFADAMIESARSLLDIARSPESDVAIRDVDLLLNDLTYTAGGLDQRSHVLDMLFTGGELANISSSELRQVLTDLQFAFIEEEDSGKNEANFMEDQFFPYLASEGSLPQIWGADDGQPGDLEHESASTDYPIGREAVQHVEVDHRAMLSNQEFQNLLVRRIQVIVAVKGWEDSAYDADGRIAEAIKIIDEL